MQNIDYGVVLDKVRTASNPSQLRITDLKICKVDLPPWGCHLIKLETNQGICGYGENVFGKLKPRRHKNG